ncbi:right-handed parallel beta-helix repeat-containing protein [Sphingobacterium humi]|uniref:Right handed beta helix domain-containing protein n=1 Tax=Sphingobacterium humi TaxID=1796905 RepID=A0A6N8L2T4_9SPHI|nr:right-handed parallel beta-helix repeat-containing protein [Sphingobacterium humi]MVZ63646.1 hypothetical protein [Sphingobacterium humi]
MIFKLRILIIIIFSGFVRIQAQSITSIPHALLPTNYQTLAIQQQFNDLKIRAVSLVEYLPRNYIKDGSRDYTKYLQKGINENAVVILPNFPVLVNDNGLQLKSNSSILFLEKSEIILKSSSKGTYNILNLEGINNVSLFYPRIKGDLTKHLGKEGEWGMGIMIKSSENVFIYNGRIENCWGDGIYVGAVFDSARKRFLKESKNIKVYNTICNSNRRNGIAIVSVDGIEVFNSTFANSRLMYPKAGIDIEPGAAKLDNVFIKNCLTYRNKARGIDLMLRKLVGTGSREINITISNHTDHSSMVGIRIAGIKKYNRNFNKTGGRITISGLRGSKNNKLVKFEDIQDYNPYFILNGDVVINEISANQKLIMKNNK